MPNSPSELPPHHSDTPLPDRICPWCNILMTKRLVAEGRFIHYTCPQCIFQHTSKAEKAKESYPPQGEE